MNSMAIVVTGALLFAACSAEARLIRGGGRATVSNNSATFVFLAEQSSVFGDTYRVPGDTLPSFEEAVMEAGSERIYTVPNDGEGDQACFTFAGSSEQADEFNATNEDCRYEFFEGEQLDFFGFMDHLLPASEFTEISWIIESVGGDFSFTFPSELTEIVPGEGSSLTRADLFLSAPPPLGLVAGEYQLRANSTQIAPQGFTYFEYAFVNSTVFCEPLNGPDQPDVCFIGGRDLGSSFENRSRPTQVSILAVATVAEPPTLALLALAAIGALIRRRRRKQ